MSTFDLESGLTTTNPVAEITLAERIRLSASLVSVTIVALCVICFRSVSYSTVPLDFQQALNSSDFSGFDAYVQLQTVASSPHPVYSPENLNVYKFITNILNEYKNSSTTEMHVLEFDSTLTFPQAMAYFPGVTKSTLLVSAHFDSVSTSVGATDDGASVVCMLQIARILAQSSLKPRNSILLLFNNGEEFHKLPNNTTDQGTASKYNEIQNNELYGWAQGSQKFLSSPNLKNHVENIKVFINLEGGGAGGKPMLLRTNNNRLSSLFATVAPYPHMNSFGQNFMSLIGTATDY
ncbi:hypothetical protein BDR26DRAFT_931665 [Obelidium mucronatum]|nr:hypothetical protein BDR26DRAFT_931665 [Obelidium mucronatum]